MSAEGHSRPARAGTKPGHVRYAPIAIKFRSEAKCRDGPQTDLIIYSITSSARHRRSPLPVRSKGGQGGAFQWVQAYGAGQDCDKTIGDPVGGRSLKLE
jgi:hypothetical protein